MFTSHFAVLAIDDLEAASGGVSGTPPAKQQEAEPRTWIERLDRNLKNRGFDPNIDPKMEIRPKEMDKGILRPRPSQPRSRDI